MLKMSLLGISAISCILFGQVSGGEPALNIASNLTGTGLCVFMVIRFGSSLDKLTAAVTELRIHCASKQGLPSDAAKVEAARQQQQ